MPQMEERLETEGRTETLAAYIKLHKEIAVPKNKINEILSRGKTGMTADEKYALKERNMFLTYLLNETIILTYIDKNENIADVRIEIDKISSLKKISQEIDKSYFKFTTLPEELESLGFYKLISTSAVNFIANLKYVYQSELEKQKQDAKKQEFDF